MTQSFPVFVCFASFGVGEGFKINLCRSLAGPVGERLQLGAGGGECGGGGLAGAGQQGDGLVGGDHGLLAAQHQLRLGLAGLQDRRLIFSTDSPGSQFNSNKKES